MPESTSEPSLKEPSGVVWAFDDIENLNQVVFEIKEEKTAIGFTPQVAVQVVVALAAIAVAAFLLAKKMYLDRQHSSSACHLRRSGANE